MTCPNRTDVGSYVLGALPPRDRLSFEQHLTGCPECTAAVRDLAGLPGLLGRVDPRVVEEADTAAPAVPGGLLDSLTRAVERDRRTGRRRLVLVSAAAAAAVAVAATTVVAVVLEDDAPPASSTSEVEDGGATAGRTMSPVGDVPVRAEVALERVDWGTRLRLDCSYDTASVEYPLPRRVDYFLYVRDRGGRVERVGSWRSIDGRTMSMDAGTATPPQDISSVEVRAPGGRVVLRLDL